MAHETLDPSNVARLADPAAVRTWLRQLDALDRRVAAFLDRLGRPPHERLAAELEATWGEAPDYVHRTLRARDHSRLEVFYLSGRVDANLVANNVVQPLLAAGSFRGWDAGGLPLDAVRLAPSPDAISAALVEGRVVLGPAGDGGYVAVAAAGPPHRTVEEPKVAQVVHGPHTGFVEDLGVNLALLRHYVRSPLLAVESLRLGRASPTRVLVVRLLGVSRPAVAALVRRRLRRLAAAGVVDSSRLMGPLGAHALVPTVQYSERPDQVAAALFAGRVAVLVETSPAVLLVPTTLAHLLSAPGDYYQPAVSASVVRLLRYAGTVVAVLLPALFVGISTVNQPLMPLPLLLSFVRSRLTIPFSIAVETFLMQVAFDLVYEAGLQVPSAFGQTVSVVGALVVGQAAVMAGIVSAPTLIAVAFAYLAQLLVPDQNLAMVLRVLRYATLVAAAVFGLIGVTAAFALFVTWGATLSPYGAVYLSPLAPLRRWSVRDALLRAPWGRRRRPAAAR
ncbi:MAG: spore germination protein [Actinomycetia bacterium]|nr:spore germination protein [Actinomycetes bacterium]